MSAERASRALEQRAFTAARNDRMRHDCWASSSSIPDAPCVLGAAASRRTLVRMGDSHAEHWLAGRDRAGRANGWRIVAMVKCGCPAGDLSGLRNANLDSHLTASLTRSLAPELGRRTAATLNPERVLPRTDTP